MTTTRLQRATPPLPSLDPAMTRHWTLKPAHHAPSTHPHSTAPLDPAKTRHWTLLWTGSPHASTRLYTAAKQNEQNLTRTNSTQPVTINQPPYITDLVRSASMVSDLKLPASIRQTEA
ncbi:hypothetical protein F2Q68_00015037 [Brassica cretica]|uniref:Uncharacterized protein n=2 Tax=Brassica cretica TaxID=69181 RepID=A0ABQ7ETM5_BRACR|nr:hypothetical protein F2Q68_00015037 [Brassica cretica]KAF3606707.1 hypothetical protein DY000_02047774 [Brassica cretica]